MKIINNTSILTEFGYRKVQDLTTNDKLLYGDDLIEIDSITKEKYSGDAYEIYKRIKFSNDLFYVLPENKIVVLDQVTSNSKRKRLFNKHQMISKKPNDIFIDGRNKFDMIVNPKIYYENNNFFNLNGDDARLIGIIIGDGHICHDKRSNNKQCQISLGYKKEKTLNFVKLYLNERTIHYWIREQTGCEVIEFTCTNINWLNRSFFYDENKLKIIHNKFLNLSKSLLIQILSCIKVEFSIGETQL